MITNERQYKITKAAAERFRTAIARAAEPRRNAQDKPLDPRLRKATVNGMRSQLKDLEAELAAYEKLKASDGTMIEGSMRDLGQMIVQARIAQGWTQKQLAERLGVHEQQVQRYEEREYDQASLLKVHDVLQTLGATTKISIKVQKLSDFPELPKTRRRPAAKVKS